MSASFNCLNATEGCTSCDITMGMCGKSTTGAQSVLGLDHYLKHTPDFEDGAHMLLIAESSISEVYHQQEIIQEGSRLFGFCSNMPLVGRSN
jgi:hypothetical protein